MWKIGRFAVWTLLALLLTGCAITTAIPVDPNDRFTWGFRVYDSKPLLLITKGAYKIVFIPNYSKAYAVRFDAFLAKNKSKVQVDNGVITGTIDVDVDSTAAIALLQDLAKQFAPPGKPTTVEDTTDLVAIYDFVFDDNGHLQGLRKLPTDHQHYRRRFS
jgi:hypothetical protein